MCRGGDAQAGVGIAGRRRRDVGDKVLLGLFGAVERVHLAQLDVGGAHHVLGLAAVHRGKVAVVAGQQLARVGAAVDGLAQALALRVCPAPAGVVVRYAAVDARGPVEAPVWLQGLRNAAVHLALLLVLLVLLCAGAIGAALSQRQRFLRRCAVRQALGCVRVRVREVGGVAVDGGGLAFGRIRGHHLGLMDGRHAHQRGGLHAGVGRGRRRRLGVGSQRVCAAVGAGCHGLVGVRWLQREQARLRECRTASWASAGCRGERQEGAERRESGGEGDGRAGGSAVRRRGEMLRECGSKKGTASQ